MFVLMQNDYPIGTYDEEWRAKNAQLQLKQKANEQDRPMMCFHVCQVIHNGTICRLSPYGNAEIE